MGLQLMPGGFLYVDDILKLTQFHGYSQTDLECVVQSNDKQRFATETDAKSGKLMIRANQGHSIHVKGLELTPISSHTQIPTVIHGTYLKAWDIIKHEGLSRMNRNHIHFAAGAPGEEGVISGMRRSSEVLISIDSEVEFNSIDQKTM